MPFILKHNRTDQVFTCPLVNTYDLVYYGTKYWDDFDAAAGERVAFLTGLGLHDCSEWELREVEDRLLKLCNVRLANNPSLQLYLDASNKPYVKEAPGR